MAVKPVRVQSQALRPSIWPQPSTSAMTGPASGMTGSLKAVKSSLPPITPRTTLT